MHHLQAECCVFHTTPEVRNQARWSILNRFHRGKGDAGFVPPYTPILSVYVCFFFAVFEALAEPLILVASDSFICSFNLEA